MRIVRLFSLMLGPLALQLGPLLHAPRPEDVAAQSYAGSDAIEETSARGLNTP